jgi:hypothetical protein
MRKDVFSFCVGVIGPMNLHVVTRAESGATPPVALLALLLLALPLLFTLAKLVALAAFGVFQNTPFILITAFDLRVSFRF